MEIENKTITISKSSKKKRLSEGGLSYMKMVVTKVFTGSFKKTDKPAFNLFTSHVVIE